jgi:hypothetical protein
VHRRQSRAQRQGVDSSPIDVQERVNNDIKCLGAALESLEGGCDILRSPDFQCGNLEAERADGFLNLDHFQHGDGGINIRHDRQPAEIW